MKKWNSNKLELNELKFFIFVLNFIFNTQYMRLNLFRTSMFMLFSLFILNCSSDDENSDQNPPEEQWGAVQIKFDNRFEGLSPIILNNTTQTSSSGQKHQFSTLKYIVSNFTLTNTEGVNFTFHLNDPDKGAFIVDQSDANFNNEVSLELDSIPAGVYTKVKFGLGISQDAYLLGGESQGEFWAEAGAEGMNWSWAAGYIFAKLEGKYGTDALDVNFINHTGNMGDVVVTETPDLYREIELDLPDQLVITPQTFPGIHFIADLNHYLSGETDLILDDTNQEAMGSSEHLVNVTNNLSKMFSISHIHNN